MTGLLLTLWIGSGRAASESSMPILVVFEIENRGSGLPAVEMAGLYDYLISQLGAEGYQIIPQTQVRERLRIERANSYKECYEQSCQIAVGRELAAQFTLQTAVSRVGTKCLLTAMLYDLRLQTSARTAAIRANCGADELVDALEQLAQNLSRFPKKAETLSKPPANVPPPVAPLRVAAPVVVPPPPLAEPRVATSGLTRALATGVLQAVVVGDIVYALNASGQVERLVGEAWELYDSGTSSKQIAVDAGFCYVLKQNGNLWRRGSSSWEQIDTSTGTKQMLAVAGRLYVLKDTGNIYAFDAAGFRWDQIDSGIGSRQIAGDASGALFVLKDNGNIWQYQGGPNQWTKIDTGTASPQITAASGVLYVRKENGAIWRYRGGQWQQIDSSGNTRQIEASGAWLYALKQDGGVWRHDGQAWVQVAAPGPTQSIHVGNGWILLVSANGDLHRLRAS